MSRVEISRERVNVHYGNYGGDPEHEILVHFSDGTYEVETGNVEYDESEEIEAVQY
jgi:hypothetical protein